MGYIGRGKGISGERTAELDMILLHSLLLYEGNLGTTRWMYD